MKLDITTKELLKKLENKSALKLMWAIIWRFYAAALVIYLAVLAFVLVGVTLFG